MPITALPIETKVATKADVGLSLVDNTADVSKPVSTFQGAALALKADAAATALAIAAKADSLLTGLSVLSASAVTATDTGLIGIGKLQAQATAEAASSVVHATSVANPHAVTKAQVGLGNADNTSDINKPISTAQSTALATKAADLLTGVSFADATDLVATDVSLTAWGKLQAKFTGIAATIRATVLTGLSTATATVVAATDSVLVAIGKLQAQTSLKVGSVTAGTNVTIGGTATAPIINASSGATSWSALTDKTTAPITTDNTPLANALATKASLPQNSLAPASSTVAPTVDAVNTGLANKGDVLASVALIGATTLTRALHNARELTFSGANATLAVASDAAGLWTTVGDSIEIHTLAGSAGVPTLTTPDGKTITGSATKIIGATRKGADSWTVGTTDPAGGVQTGIQKPWAASGASIASPLDLLDNVLLAVALPALGPNAVIVFEYITVGNGAGSKTRKVSLSATAAVGSTMYQVASANPLSIGRAIIRNRNSASSQYGNSGNIVNDDGYGSASAAAALYLATIDTSVSGKFLVFSVTKATATDVLSLDHYCISIFDPTAV